MRAAFKNPTTEHYHEWRKRVKYHYFHLELLIPLWESLIRQYSEELHHLSEMLGYDHDLCLLSEIIINDSKLIKKRSTRVYITDLIILEQTQLRAKINVLGKKVYAEKSNKLIKRIEHYWKIWENENTFAVYFMANDKPIIYTGMTNNLVRSVAEHKSGFNPRSYTSRNGLNKLVYYETFQDRMKAIIREKRIKRLGRDKKIALIEEFNPKFLDLFKEHSGL